MILIFLKQSTIPEYSGEFSDWLAKRILTISKGCMMKTWLHPEITPQTRSQAISSAAPALWLSVSVKQRIYKTKIEFNFKIVFIGQNLLTMHFQLWWNFLNFNFKQTVDHHLFSSTSQCRNKSVEVQFYGALSSRISWNTGNLKEIPPSPSSYLSW